MITKNLRKIFFIAIVIFGISLTSASFANNSPGAYNYNQNNETEQNNNGAPQVNASVTIKPSEEDQQKTENLFKNAEYKKLHKYDAKNPYYKTEKHGS